MNETQKTLQKQNTKKKKKKHTAQEGRPGIKKVPTLTLIFFPQPDPTSHRIRVPVFAMIPVHLADEWKRE